MSILTKCSNCDETGALIGNHGYCFKCLQNHFDKLKITLEQLKSIIRDYKMSGQPKQMLLAEKLESQYFLKDKEIINDI